MRLKPASTLILPLLLAACAAQNLNPTPDLQAYRSVEIIANNGGQRVNAHARHIAGAAYLELDMADAPPGQRLYIQAEACRNSSDAYCQRSYALTGDIQVSQNRLKCYLEIRNDAVTGYEGQALQGLCQDAHSRSYSITLSR